MERRLAAILFADVVGYSRLMEASEAATLAAIRTRHKEIVVPVVAGHKGRIVKLMGDGMLLEFPSSVSAVECAIELQVAMAKANKGVAPDRQVLYRMGINMGDVIVQDDDLYGDGVNIAARLENQADPGGIVISDTVYGQVRSRDEFRFSDLGERTLKNIARPLRVYSVSGARSAGATDDATAISKPGIPIVVLPFANVSGDPEQEYFSDGITDDIITDLSKISALNVLSRSTAFTFKGGAININRIAKDLKVSYVVEGTVRKSGGRVRIGAQLIDAVRDTHIWAERYDREFSDVFALQDELSRAIVSALKVRLLPQERQAIETRSTYDSEAYRLYLMGRQYFELRGARNYEIALRFCRRALQADPDYARAWALSALCLSYLSFSGQTSDSGFEAARKALTLDPTLAEAHSAMGRILAEQGRFEEALVAHRESLRLDANSFDVHQNLGTTCIEFGLLDETIWHLDLASRLSETDYTALNLMALALRSAGRHEEFVTTTYRALERIEKSVLKHPDNTNSLAHGALALARVGEKERASEWIDRAMIIESNDTTDQYNMACALAQIGDFDAAMDLLEACVPKMPAEFVLWLPKDFDLAPIRDHPRYAQLVSDCEARLVHCSMESDPQRTKTRSRAAVDPIGIDSVKVERAG
ncbi:MAG: adenylate/guanylate cyclase domain-containing protein [Rhizobiaceae bacterium]|nr:adenylate/guanylate cyclase domain-containing protein [Rhizobiaceae bacterium]